MANKAVAFIDGNNWYHCVKWAGLDPTEIDIIKVAVKLAGPRELVGIRYYVGQVTQTGNLRLHADQQRYLNGLVNQDKRVSIYYGRIEPRKSKNAAAVELLEFMSNLRIPIDRATYKALVEIGKKHKIAEYMVEKGVDVMLAVDLVTMAQRNEFDTAYLVSADGDYTHAAQFVRLLAKKVFAVSPSHGAQLAAVVDQFIHLNSAWLSDCKVDYPSRR